MRVNLGRGDMAMAKELLDRADIVAVFKKLRRETVSQRMGGSMLRDLRPLNCFLYRFLNYRLVDVVSPLHAGDPVKIPAAGREHELPSPLRIRVGILAGDRIRQCRATGALAQVLFVNTLRVLQVLDQILLCACTLCTFDLKVWEAARIIGLFVYRNGVNARKLTHRQTPRPGRPLAL